MDDEAKAARKEYQKKYRALHRDRLNELAREWNKNNPDKARAIRERYWLKKAAASEEK